MNNHVKFIDDNKKRLLKNNISEMKSTIADLVFIAKSDSLNKRNINYILNVLESNFAYLSKICDYNGLIREEVEKRCEPIKNVDYEISKLKKEVANKEDTNNIAELLNKIEDFICNLWIDKGFSNYPSVSFNSLDIKVSFPLLINISSNKHTSQYDLFCNEIEWFLVDSSNNKNLIMDMLKEVFNDLIKVKKWESVLIENTDVFRLEFIECSIPYSDNLKKIIEN